MKLNKKTIYEVKTQELFDKMMEDAKKQDYSYLHTDIWTMYKENTGVRIDEKGNMNHCSMSYYWDNKQTGYKDYYYTEYKDVPEIYPINFGCVGVDAPDIQTAYRMFNDYMSEWHARQKETDDFINTLLNKKVYAVRVDDKNTTVITPDGKTATAKCHPDDEFDVVEGFRVAMEKIKRQDIKLNQKEREILNAIVVLGGTSFYVSDDHALMVDFDDDTVYVTIEEDDFKWCEEYEDYDVKELLEQCS